MTQQFWWSVIWITALFEVLWLGGMILWWFDLRSQSAMLKHSLAECPVCQIATADVMDFNEHDIQHYCHQHLAQWMRIREKERRIKRYTDDYETKYGVKHYSEYLDE